MKVDNLEDIYELSPMQLGMLFHSLLAPESGVYVQQFCFELTGDLHVPAFHQAWQAVVERHSVLRTAFFWEELEKPVQVVYQSADLPLVLEDCRGMSAEQQAARVQALLQEERRQGFDLQEAPVMRLRLLQTGERAYQFLWSHHHILVDGWSAALLFKEVLTFYQGYSQGRGVYLEPSRPYGDYLAWLQEQSLEEAEAFWRETLRGFTAPNSLRVGRGRQELPDADGEIGHQTVGIRLTPAQTEALQAFARQQHVTVNTVVQGAWGLLVSRYSGEDDVMFGVTVSGRSDVLEGAESMIGLFINTLPLRMQVPADESVSTWLVQLQARQAEMRKFEYSPLVEIQGWSDVPQGTPMFESILVFENYPIDEMLLGGDMGLNIQAHAALEQTNYPLTLMVIPGEEMHLKITFDRDSYDEATVARLVEQLGLLLGAMVEHPQRLLGELSILTEEERRQVLVAWNETALAVETGRCVHELFAEQAARTPSAVALVVEDREMTFAELNRRANQVAHRLQRMGVGPDVRVGLCMERTFEMIVGLLGIMKAGGAYVPLDPEYPADRIAFLLEDAKAPVLLTQPHLVERLPKREAEVLVIDEAWTSLADESEEDPSCFATDENLAYVIYTSGSTGKPKGVLVEHAQVTNFFAAVDQHLHVEGRDAMLAVTSMCFDISVLELFWTLTRGVKVVLLRSTEDASAYGLGAQAAKQKATLLQCTPSLLKMFSGETFAALKSLRALILGGEALSVAQAHRVRQTLPETRLLNFYGPTEATVWATGYEVKDVGTRIPIGRPFANVQAYILDANLQPVPVGVPGELFIGGAGIARGYHRRPELTAERFLPHPYAEELGARLYKTGDLARFLPDGTIEYLGRIDHQVKIRGYRIELGEIETAIAAHTGVREAVVVAREDIPGMPQLVAYVLYEENRKLTTEDLRQFLARSLPDYMVPSLFVFLEKLPLTPNGKVDRKALPAPDRVHMERMRSYVAPRNPVEEMVTGIWSDVLHVAQVGVTDNFFELGGHSILATQVVSRISSAFQVQVPLSEFFAKPTVADLAEAIERAADMSVQTPPIAAVPRGEHPPLSFAQERFWFIEQLNPGTYAYNIPEVVRLKGQLHVRAMERAFEALIRRHESLRTRFVNVEGKPQQIIDPPYAFVLPLVDLTGRDEAVREAEALALANEIAVTPFDLATGLLLRVTLIMLAENDYLIVPVFHHIITDGWSMGVFFREIETHYMAFVDGADESPLPDLPLQYADFAHWQREWLRGEAIEKQMDYWRERLGGRLPVLQLPHDRPRPAVQGTKGANIVFHFPQSLSEKLSVLNRQEGVTMYMTLLAAFKTLLHRYSGQDDILVGTPIANRNREEVEKLIGVFVNTIVMRTDLSGEPSFRELLGQVRQAALEAYANQDVPFEKLVEELAPERHLSHSPIFQVMFVMQNAPMASLQLPGITLEVAGLTLTRVGVKRAAAKYDLTINIVESEQGMVGMMEYNTDLFEETTIARMVEHLQVLLEGIAEDPDVPLHELPLLTAAERRQVVQEWNRTIEAEEALERETATIAQLFEAQMARTPDKQALVFEERSLTFAELNERANQVAHRLRQVGVGPDVRVGLCMERSPEMVVGLLGILKAGGAYVPIDPDYPIDRIAFLLEDAAAPVLLTQPHLVERMPHLTARNAQVVVIDREFASIAQERADNLSPVATGDNLAYILYTSGSTGSPKGVLVEHRQVIHLFRGIDARVQADDRDTMLAVTSMCFDISVLELFWTLVHGVKVVLLRSLHASSEYDLATQAVQHQATLLQCTPSLLRMLNEETMAALRSLRVLILGGEALSAAQAQAVRTAWPKTRLINGYGPTETTVYATWYEVAEVTPQIPIGRPLANVQAYILDPHLQPVPIGVPGELYIGGAGVTRGYHRRPELTEERFLPDPFAVDRGARLYKTGDLARFLQDGNIEYLGRLDHQVKLRGFRIELGEVEAVLAEHPAVRDVVVLAREDHPGDHRLVAYVVTDGAEVPVSELRELAQNRLPDYMVPSVFVTLETMPLTPSGKADRNALPAPEFERQEAQSDVAAPRNEIEQAVATIYEELLHRRPIGIHDNFFEMGGHSLLATQLVSRVQAQLGVELQVRDTFEHRTVAMLSQAIAERMSSEGDRADLDTPRIRALPRGQHRSEQGAADEIDAQNAITSSIPRLPQQDAYELSHAQERIWFATQMNEAANEGGNFPILLQGTVDVAAFHAAVRAMGERHGILRTTFEERNGQPHQIVHADKPLICEYVDLSALDEAARKRALAEHAHAEKDRRIDLRTGPLFRLTLYKLEAERHLFVINAHHIAYDGWAIDVFMRDLGTLYLMYAQGRSADELPPVLQYADFAAWHNERLRTGELDDQRDYWLYHLEGVTEPPTLPYDEASAAAAEPAENITLRLNVTTTGKLRELALATESSVYMVVLSAMNIWLSRLTGQTDITIGSPLSGRNRAELEGLLGVLINPAVMRTDLTGNPSVRQVIERVKGVAFDAYANQDYPFDLIVQALRSQGTTSLYNTVLIGQNAFRSQMQLGNLLFQAIPLEKLLGETKTTAPMMPEDQAAEFDIVLDLFDRGDELQITAFPNARRFAKASFERLIEQFRSVVEQLADNPQQRLSQIEWQMGDDDLDDLFE